jgi:uncharacterized membrane protein
MEHQPTEERKCFSFSRGLLLALVVFLAVFLLPAAIRQAHVQRLLLAFAALAIAVGWFSLIKYREQNSAWRSAIALVSSVYLTASLPVFVFELSQVKWLMLNPHHSLFSAYTRLWLRWGYQGYLFVLLGTAGSFFGRGRARAAFLIGSIALLILRASMGVWIM